MEQESSEKKGFSGRGEPMRHATPPGENQKFMKNDQYFTVCIYLFVLVLGSAVGIKAIISFDQTRAFFGGLFRAIGPFLIALLIAYILNPFVKWVERFLQKHFPKISKKLTLIISMLIVYLIGVGLIIALLVYVLPEVVQNLVDLINYIPIISQTLIDYLAELQEAYPNVDFSSITNMLQDTQKDLVSTLKEIAGELIPVLYTASVSLVTWLGNALIALIVSVYMLYGKESLLRMLKVVMHAFVPKQKIAKAQEIFTECNRICSQYLISKMIDSFIIGVLCAVLMSILRLPYVLLISVVVGVTNMIPYFGPFIGAVPGIIIILCVDPLKSLVFTIMIFCLQQFDGLILGPKLLGDSTGMKPLWIIFAITIGGKFFGVLGMFLGVPVVATFGYLAEQYLSYRLDKKNIRMEKL